jgi:hypothetical protein
MGHCPVKRTVRGMHFLFEEILSVWLFKKIIPIQIKIYISESFIIPAYV